MSAEAITSYVAIAMSVGTAIIGIVNHKRIRSVCCSRKLEVSLDIETTTPPNKLELKLPADKSSRGDPTDRSSSDMVVDAVQTTQGR
jgi:hypothetical protein